MDLNEIAAFAGVVKERSFTKAAVALGIPKSTLSERVARLEEHLGVRLLERTTRSLAPTPAGVAYFDRVAHVVAELDEASASVAESHRAARGLVRIGSPALFARMFLLPVVVDFMANNPQVEVDLVVADRRFHLVEEGLDVAVLVTAPMENVVVSPILMTRRILVASTGYLAKHGTPQTPQDLAKHACVLPATMATPSRHATWTFARGDEAAPMMGAAPPNPRERLSLLRSASQSSTVYGKLVVTSVELAMQAVVADAGITIAPTFLCQPDIDAGRLVVLLPQWSAGDNELVLVHGVTRSLPFRVRLLVDFMIERLRAAAPIEGMRKAIGRSAIRHKKKKR